MTRDQAKNTALAVVSEWERKRWDWYYREYGTYVKPCPKLVYRVGLSVGMALIVGVTAAVFKDVNTSVVSVLCALFFTWRGWSTDGSTLSR